MHKSIQENLKWEKRPHPAWGKGGRQERIHDLGFSMTFSKIQWNSGKFSIISPSGATFNSYELYDGNETYSFKTLKEAKEFAEELNQ